MEQATHWISERGFFDGRPLEAQGSHLSRLLLQLLLILGTPRVLHYFLLQHLWQPRVVSEILSGIILGPTVMGKIPGWMTYVFPDFSISTLSTISSLGLVMFLYMVGLGINSNLIEQEAPFVFGAVGLSAAFCMMFAPPLTFLFWKPEGESEYSRGTYAQTMLWVAVLLGITATGVLARILAERGILAKRLGGVAMATTAINLMYNALILAIALSMFGMSYTWVPPDPRPPGLSSPLDAGSIYDPIYLTLLFFGFVLLLRFPARWLWTKLALKAERKKKLDMFIVWFALFFLFACAYVMQTATMAGRLGGLCFALFAIPRIGTFPIDLRKHVEGLVVLLFMPMFYTWSGLRTDLSKLESLDIGYAALLMVVSYICKFSAMYMIACANKMHGFKGAYFGILHATKGFAAMVMCNTAYDVGLITRKFLSIAILFSVTTTILVTPIMRGIQLFEVWFKARWGKTPAPPGEYRILVIPSQENTARPLIQLSEMLYMVRPPHSASVTALRCVTSGEMDDSFGAMYLETGNHEALAQDPILAASLASWRGDHPDPLIIKAITMPVYAQDVPAYIYGEGTTGNSLEESDDISGSSTRPYQGVIIDYEGTPHRAALIDNLLISRKVDTYVLINPIEIDYPNVDTILLLLGSSPVERDNELSALALALHMLRQSASGRLCLWKHSPGPENPLPPFGHGVLVDVPEPAYVNFDGDLHTVILQLSLSAISEYSLIIAPNFVENAQDQSLPQSFLTSTGLSNFTDLLTGTPSVHTFDQLATSAIPLIITSSTEVLIHGINPYHNLSIEGIESENAQVDTFTLAGKDQDG